MLNLIVNKGPDRGHIYTLDERTLHLLGRFNRVMSVFVSDVKVSRIHAELTTHNNQWYIRDMQSTNGTFVNNRRIHDRIALNHHDQIRIGSTLFLVDIQPNPTNHGHRNNHHPQKKGQPHHPERSGSTPARSPRPLQPHVTSPMKRHHSSLHMRAITAIGSWLAHRSLSDMAR